MVFVDFAVLPPEVISAQIHTGPGATSMLAAAAAWERLAGELHSTAFDYGSVIAELSESWAGPSSVSMAVASAPFVVWISTTAAQAEEAATKARAAAGAYEAVFAAVVPPADIAVNRTRLSSLLATNIFGQNGAAIAATEAEYEQMWSQDVAAMFAYAGASAAAGELAPFAEPSPMTNGAAESTQYAAAATAPAASVSSWLQQIEDFLNSLATGYTKLWEQLISGVTGNPNIAPFWETLYSSISGIGSQATWTNVVNSTTGMGISQWKNFFIYSPWAAQIPKSALAGGLASPAQGARIGPIRPASAILGASPTVGALSVPPGWATASPVIRLAVNALPATSLDAAPAADVPGSVLDEANLGSFTGGAVGSPAARAVRSATIQTRATTNQRRIEPVKLDRVIAQLQEQPDRVQHWSVDEAGLDDLVARLRTTPGVHAVHVRDDEDPVVTAPDSSSVGTPAVRPFS